MTNEDQFKTSPGAWVKIFLNNLHQSQEGKEIFRKTKKVLMKIYKIYLTFTALQIASQIYILGSKLDQNAKLYSFSLQYQPSWRQPRKLFPY